MTGALQLEADCCVVGGGPAGVMTGLLFARAGVRTIILEKHADFLRDFRGDTVHPSTLQVIGELGLLDDFLKRPHDRMHSIGGVFYGERLKITDFSALPVACKFIAMMPQWHFLDFLADNGRPLRTFDLRMNAEATGLIENSGRVTGVRAQIRGKPAEIRAKLIIGADGRHSVVRQSAGLERDTIGAAIDVLWFRIPRRPRDAADDPLFYAGNGHALVTINRGDYYQCAFIIPKGGAQNVRAGGIAAFRAAVASTVPAFGSAVAEVRSFDDVKLLTVAMDRLKTWSKPGLLMIGDAAHAMSPVGGVGINLAIQDAVAAANLFAEKLASGELRDDDLSALRRRRILAVGATQFMQSVIQNRIVTPLITGAAPPHPPLPLRIVARTPFLQRRIAAIVGLGFRPEHVRSPQRPVRSG
jgi:2-polyprenyl-6-methoxyphenol hydroxylase-like FAD-dependent oxidoreductase